MTDQAQPRVEEGKRKNGRRGEGRLPVGRQYFFVALGCTSLWRVFFALSTPGLHFSGLDFKLSF
jgi:hypothetical protein